MIDGIARQAVGRLLDRIETVAADSLPPDVRVERDGDTIALVGPRVRLRALTDARIAGLVHEAVRR